MVRGADGRHDLLAVGSQLSVLVENVLPALLIQDDDAAVGVGRLGKGAQVLAALWATALRGARSSPSRSAVISWIAGTQRGYSDAELVTAAFSRVGEARGTPSRMPSQNP